MKNLVIRLLTLVVATTPIGIDAPIRAQTAYPMLMSIEPVAAQVGDSSEHTIRARYSMLGAYAVFVSGTGVRGEVVPVRNPDDEKPKTQTDETLMVRFNVDANTIPGVRDVRIATPVGVSTVGQLVIVADPVFQETDDSGVLQTHQSIRIPTAICGRIEKAEDVDRYKFNALEDDEITFHVVCLRLQFRIHDLQKHADPIIAIRNSSGSIIASSDNAFRGDPFIRHKFNEPGEYELEIRDVRYQGNPYWGYCIEVNRRPFVTGLFPIGIVKGSAAQVELIGYGLDSPPVTELFVPSDATEGIAVLSVSPQDSIKQPVSVVMTDLLPQAEFDAYNNVISMAQSISIPGGLNGRIEKDGDLDLFAFDAKKGERFTFDVLARRARSSLDSHLRILGPEGNELQLNDDLKTGKLTVADSMIENWTVPNDGRYFVEIRDLHLRGGKAFTYFLIVTKSTPSIALYADSDKTLIRPGTSGIVYVRAERKNGFDGEIQLHVTGLPPGVTASCGRILTGKGQDGCIVFQAAPDTAPVATNITISGTMTRTASDGTISQSTANAVVYQEMSNPGGSRGHWPVENHAVAVCEKGDIRRVSLDSNEITLKPGSSQRIGIEVERAEGFDKNITLEMIYMHLDTVFGNPLPEGVTVDAAASNTLLTGGATKGHITLKATENAPEVVKQQIVVLANVSLNFTIRATYASQALFVNVKK